MSRFLGVVSMLVLVFGYVAATAFPIFVGKGEVQSALGWNNQQLQANWGDVDFSLVTVEETTWECFNSNNDRIQERSRTTTTEGLTAVDERNNRNGQVTGFTLTGFDGGTSTETEGNQLNSCPSGPWSLVAGSTETELISTEVVISN